MNEGVYSYQRLKEANRKGYIRAKGAFIPEEQIQPASIDLRLGTKAYRLVSSFLPEKRFGSVEKLLTGTKSMYDPDMLMYEQDLAQDGAILEQGCVYLIPLMEELKLPAQTRGKANPKSTTGRLDIFARVITEVNPWFDEIPAGYNGKLYLEVVPRSYTIKVRAGMSLVQLRLMQGKCVIDDSKLRTLHNDVQLLYKDDTQVVEAVTIADGLFMSVDLSGSDTNGIIGYKSKRNSHVVDLTKRNYYNINEFWEPVYSKDKSTLILEPEVFYILSSKEKIRVPHGYAAEMAPYAAGSGELRTHYAGFFDPGFGYGPKGEILGTKAVLEVRAHDVPFMIADGQTFCKLHFEKMIEVPEKVYGPKIGSSYQFQGITLSKQFKNPPQQETMEE